MSHSITSHPCPWPAALWDDPAALSVHTVQPFNPITRMPWDQSPHSGLLRHVPRRRQDTKPFPLETTAVSGGKSPALPLHGAGVLPRVSYLAHSDNASSPHQSPGKPCCTHSACHRRTRVKKRPPSPSTSIPKAGWKAVHAGAVGSQRKHLAIHQLHPASRWTDTLVWIKELSWCSLRLGSAKSMCAPHAWLSHVQTEHTVSLGSV